MDPFDETPETENAAFWRPTDDDNPKSPPRYEKASGFVNAMIGAESQNYRSKKVMFECSSFMAVWMTHHSKSAGAWGKKCCRSYIG